MAMLYSLTGKLVETGDNFLVLEISGFGLKVFTHRRTLANLPPIGSGLKIFSYLYLREEGLELYGFLNTQELEFFELLISVSGVGPKSAISIMDVAELKNLLAAIKEERPDLLTRAAGIGRKTGERIILELKSKVHLDESGETVKRIESDVDLIETLCSLGYRRDEVRIALEKVGSNHQKLEDRLRLALKILTGKKPE
ncbi:MAG: Holliday junction branch migration protein RuvA [Candidatus Liptonbacteria bacterium]|nr:Holliday junction branch migration protein RuvA [Candidatus Liptonbacteria bacterium]